MDISKSEKYDKIMRTLGKDWQATFDLQTDYEGLRPGLEKHGGPAAIATSPEAAEIAKKMQGIEALILKLWKPHQDLVGICPACTGVRVPGAMPQGYGFGCMTCHDFEVYQDLSTA